MICGIEGIKNYFETGRGSVKVRGSVGVEESRAAGSRSSSPKSRTT